MLKKFVLGIAALGATGVALPAAAEAQYYPDYRYARNYGYQSGYYNRGYRTYPYYNSGYRDRGYYGNSYGYDRRYRRNHRCGSGTTGAIVGGAAGALLGREIARGSGRGYYGYRRGGNGTLGAITGGAAGALVGREIGRSC
jgi:hypothetical protein